MKYLFLAMLSMAVTPASAAVTAPVPEMDAGAGIAAIALLAGVVAIIREKSKRK